MMRQLVIQLRAVIHGFTEKCDSNLEITKKKIHGLSPRANYTDRTTTACRRSDCQLLRIEGATWLALRILKAVFSVL
jgi:hypothetical protein